MKRIVFAPAYKTWILSVHGRLSTVDSVKERAGIPVVVVIVIVNFYNLNKTL